MRDRNQAMRQHEHNSHFGRATLSRACIRAILNSPSTTDDTKGIAVRIEQDLNMLLDALEYRVNCDGTTTKIKHNHKRNREKLNEAHTYR